MQDTVVVQKAGPAGPAVQKRNGIFCRGLQAQTNADTVNQEDQGEAERHQKRKDISCKGGTGKCSTVHKKTRGHGQAVPKKKWYFL